MEFEIYKNLVVDMKYVNWYYFIDRSANFFKFYKIQFRITSCSLGVITKCEGKKMS